MCVQESDVQDNNFCVQIADICLGKCIAAEDLVAESRELNAWNGDPVQQARLDSGEQQPMPEEQVIAQVQAVIQKSSTVAEGEYVGTGHAP